MSQFVLSQAASEDLLQIRAYIAQDNPSIVSEVLQRFEQTMKQLVIMPHLGHLREDLANEQLRVFPLYSYLIIYRPKSVPLEIVRVVSGFQDLSATMQFEDHSF